MNTTSGGEMEVRNSGETLAERLWREHPDAMARAHTELRVEAVQERLAAAEAVIEKVREFCRSELAAPADPDGYGKWHDEGFGNACERVLLIVGV